MLFRSDGSADRQALRKDVIVTNMHGVHGDSMSESAILSMLALARDLPRNIRHQGRHDWERWPSRLIQGKTVGVLGVGAIAEALAPRLKALGLATIGISSGVRPVPGFDRMEPKARLVEIAGELDYFILLTPYTVENHHLVDGKVLAAMRRGAFLINLARGGVVDETALIEALRTGHLGGAALDVFAKEPLAADSPLWAMENVIITCHVAGLHDEYPEIALPIIIENLRRFAAGRSDEMTNVVPH